MSARFEGDREVRRRLNEYARKYPRALAAALYAEGMDIWGDAVRRTPVEFGVLRNSAYVSPPMDANYPYVEIGFGTKYAVYQHEREELNHPRGGEAKFLQKALDARRATMLQSLATRTEKNVQTNVGVDALKGIAPNRPRGSSVGRIRKAAKKIGRTKRRKK